MPTLGKSPQPPFGVSPQGKTSELAWLASLPSAAEPPWLLLLLEVLQQSAVVPHADGRCRARTGLALTEAFLARDHLVAAAGVPAPQVQAQYLPLSRVGLERGAGASSGSLPAVPPGAVAAVASGFRREP